MLIRRTTLDRIAGGEVDLQFRRWKRPTVRAGGTLRTAVGILDILSVDRVPMASLTADDAHRAGYPTRKALLDHMRATREGHVYRIGVSPGGTDPLIALRSNDTLSEADVATAEARLDRLDAHAPNGPWTETYLRLLAERPHVRAQDLAESIGLDKPTFKGNVRKLKALGLTISHSPGYELSPRGKAYLASPFRRR